MRVLGLGLNLYLAEPEWEKTNFEFIFFALLLPGSAWSHGDGRATGTARIHSEFLCRLPRYT